jgi:hypothetical protein
MTRTQHLSKRAKWIVYTTTAIVFPNFFAFVIGSILLGGDALNGYVKSGHFFVCSHGSCNEVSAATWSYSYWHAIAAMAGIVLVMLEVATLTYLKEITYEHKYGA